MRRALLAFSISALFLALGASSASAADVVPYTGKFGEVRVGTTASKTYKISRAAPSERVNITLELVTSTPQAWQVTDNCPPVMDGTNPEAQSCTVTVRFTPPSTGLFLAELEFSNSLTHPDLPPLDLRGTGVSKSSAKGCKKKGKGKRAGAAAKKGCKKGKGKKK